VRARAGGDVLFAATRPDAQRRRRWPQIARISGFQLGVDVYNVFNSSAVLNYNQAFIPGGAWFTPTGVLSARFAKISLQADF
jgi:hypothetical protein